MAFLLTFFRLLKITIFYYSLILLNAAYTSYEKDVKRSNIV